MLSNEQVKEIFKLLEYDPSVNLFKMSRYSEAFVNLICLTKKIRNTLWSNI